jgi:hypothetical protein
MMTFYTHAARPAKLMPRDSANPGNPDKGSVLPPLEKSGHKGPMSRTAGAAPSPSGKSVRPPLEKSGHKGPMSRTA